ncbi:MAG: SGNH/GDSL hydrolase family protein [Acidobacteria bacterium]|nr:SGNH/GDSL hydrolase family protein [Acidobacteriota bacterium]
MRTFLLLGMLAFAVSAAEVKRENIEWLDVWLPNCNDHDLPRVLLIGDSITRGYYAQVEAGLKGRAYVARLTTSKSLGDPSLLDEVALVLRQIKFDVIHFNNGMHGHAYSEEEYTAAFPGLIATLRRHAPGAKLMWASTTDVRLRGNLEQVDPRTARLIRRNESAAAIAKREKIPVDDLFTVIKDHPEYHAPDGVHFNGNGSEVLARQVAREVAKLLPR